MSSYRSRTKETTTSTSASVIALAGAAAGYRSFATKHAIGETGIEVVVDDGAGNWVEGVYTLTDAITLTRTTLLGSSNADADLTFGAGTKTVFETVSGTALRRIPQVTSISATTVIPLSQIGSVYMTPQTVAGNVTLTLGANPIQGALLYTSYTADGSSTITMPAGFKEWGGSQGYDNRAGIKNQLQLFYDGADYWYSWSQAVGAVAAASAVTMTGPTGGAVSVASSNFSIGVSPVGGTISGTVVVTPSDGGGGGTFTPTTVSLTTAAPTATFTYTPSATAGARTISVTNNGGLTNPSNITYTSTSASYPRLGSLNGITESGTGPYSYSTTNVSGFGTNGGVTTTGLQASVDGSFAIQNADITELILGTTTGTTPIAFASMPQAVYTNGVSNYLPFTAGTSGTAANAVARANGDIVRMRRTGTSLVAEVARTATPTVFTTIFTWTVSATTTYKFDVSTNAAGSFNNLTAVGLA